jgi:hypothetical protein
MLDAATFHALFRNTPVSLEYGNFADYFSRELQRIKRVIEHCKRLVNGYFAVFRTICSKTRWRRPPDRLVWA